MTKAKQHRTHRRLYLSITAVLLVVATSIAWLNARVPAPQESQRNAVAEIGIDLHISALRLAVADFRRNAPDVAPLAKVFDDVLWSDLDQSGIFELVSKSFYPPTIPATQQEMIAPAPAPNTGSTVVQTWGQPPTSAQAVAFGNAGLVGGNLVVEGYLYDTHSQQPGILARRYVDTSTEASARMIAHRFADAIIQQLGGGLPGIAESKIYYCHRTGASKKEIWVMDYDGANARPVTQYGTISTTPAVSPDGAKLAFTTYIGGAPQIYIFSTESMRRLSFANPSGSLNTTPAFSPDSSQLAFTSSITGDPEIYVSTVEGRNLRRLTNARGVDITPAWNPKTGGQIAFVSGRGGVPQVYVMDSDGSNVRRLTAGEGDAVTPQWAPNGQVLTFSWTRGFAPGNYNVFLMEVASGRLVQLTHGAGRNEHPYFSPDGRHIVFESNRKGVKQIFAMLADGTKVRALTTAGENTSPVWSAH